MRSTAVFLLILLCGSTAIAGESVESVRDVDFQSFVYPIWGEPVLVEEGATPESSIDDPSEPRVVAVNVSYGDLSGDAQAEAAILLGWRAGGNGYFTKVLICARRDGTPVLLDTIEGGDRALAGIQAIGVSEGRLLHLHREQGGPCGACPGPTVIETYRWVGGRFQLQG